LLPLKITNANSLVAQAQLRTSEAKRN
jgi:hypothetical protein